MIEISKRIREVDKMVNLAETNYLANIGNKYRPVTIVVINCVINAKTKGSRSKRQLLKTRYGG